MLVADVLACGSYSELPATAMTTRKTGENNALEAPGESTAQAKWRSSVVYEMVLTVALHAQTTALPHFISVVDADTHSYERKVILRL